MKRQIFKKSSPKEQKNNLFLFHTSANFNFGICGDADWIHDFNVFFQLGYLSK